MLAWWPFPDSPDAQEKELDQPKRGRGIESDHMQALRVLLWTWTPSPLLLAVRSDGSDDPFEVLGCRLEPVEIDVEVLCHLDGDLSHFFPRQDHQSVDEIYSMISGSSEKVEISQVS